jgi:predicted transposase
VDVLHLFPRLLSDDKKSSPLSLCKKEMKKIWRIYVLKDPNKGEGKGMKTVRVMKIVSHDESQLCSLDELMRVFGSAKRYAFHRLLEGRNAKDIIKHLPHQFRLNKRYAEDTVLLVQSLISSQRELLPMRLVDVQAKMKKPKRKSMSINMEEKHRKKSIFQHV